MTEIERAEAELEHWLKVHAEHPEWANPKIQVEDAKAYLAYLRNQSA